jgi:hypothetical protein
VCDDVRCRVETGAHADGGQDAAEDGDDVSLGGTQPGVGERSPAATGEPAVPVATAAAHDP